MLRRGLFASLWVWSCTGGAALGLIGCGQAELLPTANEEGAGGQGGAASSAEAVFCAAPCIPLFEGVDASGWRFIGGGEMSVQHGYARTHGDGFSLGLWYYALQPFKNFELKLEFRQSVVGANSGVFVRFPDPRGNVLRPISEGYEVQIAGAPGTVESTGAIYSFQAADPGGELTEPGLFNQLQIRAIEQTYEVSLNGRLINAFMGKRGLEGYIGIQVHDSPTDIVDVRRVEITPMP